MTDNMTPEQRSQTMSRIRARDTKPELAVRRLLHARGLRYRVDYRVVAPGRSVRADIAFPRLKVAVFIDGCFWHRCPEHGVRPQGNFSYWEGKLDRNVERDREVATALAADGWRVVRIWEHATSSEALAAVLDALPIT